VADRNVKKNLQREVDRLKYKIPWLRGVQQEKRKQGHNLNLVGGRIRGQRKEKRESGGKKTDFAEPSKGGGANVQKERRITSYVNGVGSTNEP